MSISKRYSPQEIETKWYQYWEQQGYFHSVPDEREPFAIVIPPPNVTGVLHMGHMLNNTIQDILVRQARLDGKNACWVPGTDHASIATEAKVVRLLREKGIKKSDLTREAFLEKAWEWREKYGGIILRQLRKLGASCDWERTAFTMDEIRSKAVIRVFVDLYRKNKIYRGYRMVNWDPQARTVLSNEEVLYAEEETRLYYVRYPLVDPVGEVKHLVVATTRPETILGDTALAVHPEDPRYRDIIGKRVTVPLIDRPIPVIGDDYVDREFGTGALKITPAHDPNDYEIGLRHDLEVIDVLNPDGTMAEAAQLFVGLDRDVARDEIVNALHDAGYLEKTEAYTHSVGRSERTHAVVEPRLSLQWYVDMSSLAKPALDAVLTDEIRFFPKKYKNIYRHWMENIRDWCISRQLWWGQRIPAWYLEHAGEELVFVGETVEEVLVEAKEKTGRRDLTAADLRQDEDVVDTWFSSWLWPISVFDGFESDTEVDYYYPTAVLVTAWDIIFLWVARMIMAGYEWRGEMPFKHVYFTGMVKDKQRRKMSKSLGNSPDALGLIDQYGADGVRFGILSSSPAGGDLLFDEKLCEQGRNFCNKLWNALRLIKGWNIEANGEPAPPDHSMAFLWFESLLSKTEIEVREKMVQYRLSDALMSMYHFIWNDFCSWYLEMIKPPFGKAMHRVTFDQTIQYYERICTLLHPFMPFITEEIWHQLKPREKGDDCIISKADHPERFDPDIIDEVELLKAVITKLREIRNRKGIPMRDPLPLFIEESRTSRLLLQSEGGMTLLKKLGVLDQVDLASESDLENVVAFVAGQLKCFTVLSQDIDVEAERARIRKEIDRIDGFLKGVSRKLGNEQFVQNAPAQVVDRERKKLADGQAKLQLLRENLEALR